MSNAPFMVSGCLSAHLCAVRRAPNKKVASPGASTDPPTPPATDRPTVAIDAAGSYRSQAAKIEAGKNYTWIILLPHVSSNGTQRDGKGLQKQGEPLDRAEAVALVRSKAEKE